ncbi:MULTISPECIES: UbiH/UbiF/VisC/COQ6 family ubiquinone biosynthesis hydroxylase [Halomonadaceae]|uniref:UbiH/UbiF/VisC/COQ6 family ubiquinone biosynthesis hydroxylase n=1 Tax=Halomonadaceae TaxID=28256 RepID=UPI001598700B|nr:MULTISPECIES: UbiH/UbiF/VisC/COQ6 family ubiquinone biosynthesis hydroxylase [Halomonas]QJQ95564.1 UbiH/UbiF/VisC/COQ6 family ubiquinone biosynthesis hydroxylase [Halomonas sp. PA5]
MQAEVIVVGGGMVGATLAALLGEAGVRVGVLDARLTPLVEARIPGERLSLRVSALTPVSQRLLNHLQVWPSMAARRVTPYAGMEVWDSQGSGRIRFTADQAGVACLGHIVENDITLAALEARLAELPSVEQWYDARVTSMQGEAPLRELILADGRRCQAPLVVAADGARSYLRDLAGIDTAARDTGQVAVVTTVRVSRGHGGVARQVFLPTGPLAFLPLTLNGDAHYCSIVWSTTPEEAMRLGALSRQALGNEMASAFEHRLGDVEVIDEAVSVPLVQRHAREYVQPGLALIGDAAHSIHPLAGQGVNLGLMDAAVLAEELLEARRRGASLGDERILSRYARRRRGDNATMLTLMDGFRLLFGTENPALQLARNLGLSGVDRLTPLKRMIMRQAVGERGRLPASCR